MRVNDDRSLFFWVNCPSISGENMAQVCSHCWQNIVHSVGHSCTNHMLDT